MPIVALFGYKAHVQQEIARAVAAMSLMRSRGYEVSYAGVGEKYAVATFTNGNVTDVDL
jgi:hypothetical protein